VLGKRLASQKLVTSIITKDLPKPGSARRLAWLLGVGTVVAVCIVFWPVLCADFVAWGDDTNIYQNPRIQSFTAENLKWMFTETGQGTGYQPLAWLTWAAIWAAVGAHSPTFHAANLLLHCLNAAILFLLVPKLLRVWAGERWSVAYHRHTYVASAAAAVVWALHPLRVEPVAWVSGLPYNLSLFFVLLSVSLYVHPYVSHASVLRIRILYWSSFGCFVAALLSCSIVLMYPVLLMLIDRYVPEAVTGKTGLLLPDRPKWIRHIPFLIVSASFIGISIFAPYSQTHGQHTNLLQTCGYRLEGVIQALHDSVWKVWWPRPLLPVAADSYDSSFPSHASIAAGLVASAAVVAATYGLFRLRQRWPTVWRLWVAHWLLLVPVIAFMRTPPFSADRDALIAGIIWAWLLAGMLYRLCLRVNIRALACGLSVIVITILAAVSAKQIAIWQDSSSLFTDMLRTTPAASPQHSRVASAFSVDPKYPVAHHNLHRPGQKKRASSRAVGQSAGIAPYEP
jgi:hypothetical protein